MPFAIVEPLAHYVHDLPLVLADAGDGSPPENVPSPLPELAWLAGWAKRALLVRDWDALADLLNRCRALERDARQGRAEAAERLIAAALTGGADGAKMAGAGGGAVVALTHDPVRTIKALRDAGASILLSPHPSPGLTVSVEVTV